MADDATTSGQSTASGASQGFSFKERLIAENALVSPYGEPTYWDERYENNRREFGQNYSFDWYCGTEKIIDLVELHVGKERGAKILVLGCGNSNLSKAIFDKGYRSITSLDISPIVVSQMIYRFRECEGMEYVVGDAMNLSMFPDKYFDAVIEKGCVDCIFCSYNGIDDALMCFSEAHRLLKPEGKFMSFSYGSQETRAAHMRLNKWDVELTSIPYSHGVVLFIATKWKEVSAKQKLKVLLKYGGAMAKNTSTIKEATKPVETRHSDQTRHGAKAGKLGLQGYRLLSAEEEKALELDPEARFDFDDVKDVLASETIEVEKLAADIRKEQEEEEEQILRGRTTTIDVVDKNDIGSVLQTSILKNKPKEGNRNQSAVWNLARKSMAAEKVMDEDADGKIYDDDEMDAFT